MFEDKTHKPAKIASRGLASAKEWEQAQTTNQPEERVLHARDNRRQEHRALTPVSCHIDASWDASTHRSGIA